MGTADHTQVFAAAAAGTVLNKEFWEFIPQTVKYPVDDFVVAPDGVFNKTILNPLTAFKDTNIIVQPEKITDADSVNLARDIRKKIEEGMEYPGQIKVTVIRETRAIEYAK